MISRIVMKLFGLLLIALTGFYHSLSLEPESSEVKPPKVRVYSKEKAPERARVGSYIKIKGQK